MYGVADKVFLLAPFIVLIFTKLYYFYEKIVLMFEEKGNPEVRSLESYPDFAWLHSLDGKSRKELIICKIDGSVKVLPHLYNTPYYCIEFLVRGNILMDINRKSMDIRGGSGFFIFTDYSFLVKDSSEDVELYILALSPQLAEELGLHVSDLQIARVYVHPVMQMSGRNMEGVLHYFDLMCDLVTEPSREALLHLLRSFLLYLSAISEGEVSDRVPLTRPEELTGQFLALVDAHCREHHSVGWYASEMCLTPKYISNVIKQTLGFSPGRCIGEAIIRQAKSMLSSTSLTIQEIADRLGFQNQSHFGTFFHRYTGLNPTNYRKRVSD